MKYNGKELLSDLKFYNDYSKWLPELNRYENWQEAAKDVIDMHRTKYKNQGVDKYLDFAEELYSNKTILASQRNLQYRGEQVLNKNERIYNCVTSYMDSIEKVQQAFYLSLCGCGITLNFHNKWTDKLPNLIERDNSLVKNHIVEDTIEGWANSVGILISSFCSNGVTFPEYQGSVVRFDYSEVRPKGAFISGGFKAPGPDGLKQSIERIEAILNDAPKNVKIKNIDIYDIIMHSADATLSGGVRRAAFAVMIDARDKEMINAKTGDWRTTNKQRERSNNSVILIRGKFNEEEFNELFKINGGMSDLGFCFVDNEYITFNPCVTGDTKINLRIKVNNKFVDWEEDIQSVSDKFLLGYFSKKDNLKIKSYNTETNEIEYKSFENIIFTKFVDELIIIEAGGKIIKCTPEHKVYTKNRGYVMAKNLIETDELLLS